MPGFKPKITALVIAACPINHPSPIQLVRGEIVRMGKRDVLRPGWVWCTGSSGRGCWVPESFLIAHAEGLTGWLTRDYCSAELGIQPGEWVTLHYQESGWWWATSQAGQNGWVPADHLCALEPCGAV